MSFLETMRDILHSEGLSARTEQRTDPTQRVPWLRAWRELAALTNGIVKEDPRFPHIMAALDRCDTAYLAGDWLAFREAAEQVRQAVQGGYHGG